MPAARVDAIRLSRVTRVPTIAPAGAIRIVSPVNPGVDPVGKSPESVLQPAAITARLPTTALTACHLNRFMFPSWLSTNIVRQRHRRPIESLTFG